MKFPCLELSFVRIPETIMDNGFVEIVFNDTKYNFQYSIKDFGNNSNSWTAIKTREIGYVFPVGDIMEDHNNLITHWGVFVHSPQIEKIIVETGKELTGVYLSDVCGEILIISGWQEYDYKLVFIPFNK